MCYSHVPFVSAAQPAHSAQIKNSVLPADQARSVCNDAHFQIGAVCSGYGGVGWGGGPRWDPNPQSPHTEAAALSVGPPDST